MRTILVAFVFMLSVPALALAQGTVVKSDTPQKVILVENEVPQDDPGECKLDVAGGILQIMPPKHYKVPSGKSCSTICKVEGKAQAVEFGCDISAALGSDGTVCSRKMPSEGLQELKLVGVVLQCNSSTP